MRAHPQQTRSKPKRIKTDCHLRVVVKCPARCDEGGCFERLCPGDLADHVESFDNGTIRVRLHKTGEIVTDLAVNWEDFENKRFGKKHSKGLPQNDYRHD